MSEVDRIVQTLKDAGHDVVVLHHPIGKCRKCGETHDLAFGYCFDCAHAGQLRAAKRTAWQHIARANNLIWHRHWTNARIELRWAWERLTQTGDYKPGGTF